VKFFTKGIPATCGWCLYAGIDLEKLVRQFAGF
jgi:hypothetical protein